MKLGIMGAMYEEINGIKKMMSDVSTSQYCGRTFYEGIIHGIPVVLTVSRWGKVASAITAAMLIERFNIKTLVFTGVAGGVGNRIMVGDVVISSKLYQHDMDATPLFQKHEIPFADKIYFHANEKLIQKAISASQLFFDNRLSYIPQYVFQKFSIKAPKVKLGIIGSGDQFVNDINITKTILLDRPDTDAVEMEGAAVAQVCDDLDIPFVIIRTISDRADNNAHVDFTSFVNEVASHYSEYIVSGMLSIK